ncbi:MAG: hypothetical protein JSS34_08350 [Proteobacteria bacterium]|nr:hypothetical protein [Pseudomonadota bacterium]
MKLEVIGKKEPGYLIQGKVRIGQEIVIRHQGKVERSIVVRTKRYTHTGVSFDQAAVMIKGSKAKAKGPISKGLNIHAEVIALGGQTI